MMQGPGHATAISHACVIVARISFRSRDVQGAVLLLHTDRKFGHHGEQPGASARYTATQQNLASFHAGLQTQDAGKDFLTGQRLHAHQRGATFMGSHPPLGQYGHLRSMFVMSP